jgi:membrane-bound inhibitor of C-type lysozyme
MRCAPWVAALALLASCASRPPTHAELSAEEAKLASDPEIREWAEKVMTPFWKDKTEAVILPCARVVPEGETQTVRLVVAVRSGEKARQIFDGAPTPFSQCLAGNMRDLVWPEIPPQLRFLPLEWRISNPKAGPQDADQVIFDIRGNSPSAGNVRRAKFTCDNGEELQVVFFKTLQIADLIRNKKGMELRLQPSGSGFQYSNGMQTIRGKGDDLTIEVADRAPLQCKAQPE